MPQLPAVPEGLTHAEFGHKVMRWGNGDAEARRRISSLTLQELREWKVTLDMAREWHNFYRSEVIRVPRNPSVRGRIDLMARAIELLEGNDD